MIYGCNDSHPFQSKWEFRDLSWLDRKTVSNFLRIFVLNSPEFKSIPNATYPYVLRIATMCNGAFFTLSLSQEYANSLVASF